MAEPPRKSYLLVSQANGTFAVEVKKGGAPEAFIPGFPTHERALDEIARLKAVDAEQEQHKKRNA